MKHFNGTKIMLKLFKFLGTPFVIIIVLLVCFSPGYFILSMKLNRWVLYVIAYLFVFYLPAVIASCATKNIDDVFSVRNIELGALAVVVLGLYHLVFWGGDSLFEIALPVTFFLIIGMSVALKDELK